MISCGGSPAAGPTPGGDNADQIGPVDDPNRLFSGASFKLVDNIVPGDVDQDIGVDDDHIPYPDTYWPFDHDPGSPAGPNHYMNGIDMRWNAPELSPLEKYMSLADSANTNKAKDWEAHYHGSKTPKVQGWWGHCPGWTGAAMANAPIVREVFAKKDDTGAVVACNQGDDGCIGFQIGDINALEAEVYVNGASNFIGARCDIKPEDIQRDDSGRIIQRGCKGLNAGSMLVVAGNLLKVQKKPFAIDAQDAFRTDQIWNQPVYRYHVYRYETLDEAQAANLVVSGTKDGSQTTYQWNSDAHGWVLIDIGLKWVSENGPNTTLVSGADSTHETRFIAVIELDRDATDPETLIIGGEIIDDKTVEDTGRLTNSPYVWLALGPGPENEVIPSNANPTNYHNPFVKPSIVQQLIALGQK
jgi:hypothetical protein